MVIASGLVLFIKLVTLPFPFSRLKLGLKLDVLKTCRSSSYTSGSLSSISGDLLSFPVTIASLFRTSYFSSDSVGSSCFVLSMPDVP